MAPKVQSLCRRCTGAPGFLVLALSDSPLWLRFASVTAALTGVEQPLFGVQFCTSSVTAKPGTFCVLPGHWRLFEKWLFQSLAHFLIGLVFSLFAGL